MESTKEILFTATCPNCAYQLHIEKGKSHVTCEACESTFPIINGKLVHSGLATQDASATEANIRPVLSEAIVQSIDNSESGLFYIQDYFAHCDWADYCTNSVTIEIEEISSMVEKNKARNATIGATWLLEFESLATPISHKLDYMKTMEDAIAEAAIGQIGAVKKDEALAYELFDRYRLIGKQLSARVLAPYVKRMESDIENAGKFGIAEENLDGMKSRLHELKEKIRALVVSKELYDIPAFKRRYEDEQRQIAQKILSESGNDAEKTYRLAVSLLETDRNAAIRSFASIPGYRDADEYQEKLNRVFRFDDTVYSIAGNVYIAKKAKHLSLQQNPDFSNKGSGFGCGKKKAAADAAAQQEAAAKEALEFSSAGNMLDFYPTKDGIPVDTPLVREISYIIAIFGSKLYYLKRKKAICVYDLDTLTETVLNEGSLGCYDFKKNYFKTIDPKKILIEKTLKYEKPNIIEKSGCNPFKKKQLRTRNALYDNNYSLLLLDLENATITEAVPAMVDLLQYTGYQFFYSCFIEPDDAVPSYMMYNVKENKSSLLLSDDCEIHVASDSVIVYSKWTPNRYNKTLYSLNLKTGETVVLEENIYSFYQIADGRIYYTVGNEKYRPLFSIKTDGTERTEIMPHVESIWFVRSGWMYLIRNIGDLRILLKTDLTGKRRIFICEGFKQLVKFVNGWIYYLDDQNSLHIVRSDGQYNREIADEIDPDNLIIDREYIYYIRKDRSVQAKLVAEQTPAEEKKVEELVTTFVQHKKETDTLSLYKMDLYGHNIKKLLYGIVSMKEFDQDTIYFEREEEITYEVTTPVSKKKDTKRIVNRKVTRYYALNKKDNDITLILSLGLLELGSAELKAGCFGKTFNREETAVIIPNKIQYENSSAKPGSVYFEQTGIVNEDEKSV